MKIIKLTKKQLFDKGNFGLYFKISSKYGVKIDKKSGYKSKYINLNSLKNQRIIKEATIGKIANGPTKELVIVKFDKKYFLGIKQNHIYGHFDENLNILNVKKKLIKNKVIHSDLHHKNVIINKKGYNIIDYDPDFSYFVGDKKLYYTIKNSLIKDLKKL